VMNYDSSMLWHHGAMATKIDDLDVHDNSGIPCSHGEFYMKDCCTNMFAAVGQINQLGARLGTD
jgi:hypothetical protein